MVNDEGQLYTIEGIAAAALIMTTVYLVLNSAMVFTPGETHIYDMQLEQIGNDVLAVMDQPTTWEKSDPSDPYPKSPLEEYIENYDKAGFRNMFREYSTATTAADDNIQFQATIYYNTGGQVTEKEFGNSQDYYRENAVVVTRWVNIKDGHLFGGEARPQTVLLEVLLWRG
jgi:hypothetical protein